MGQQRHEQNNQYGQDLRWTSSCTPAWQVAISSVHFDSATHRALSANPKGSGRGSSPGIRPPGEGWALCCRLLSCRPSAQLCSACNSAVA